LELRKKRKAAEKAAKENIKKKKHKPIKNPKKAVAHPERVTCSLAEANPELLDLARKHFKFEARLTLSARMINLSRLKKKFKVSQCNVEIFPFIGVVDLVLMKQINKVFCARITNYFKINQVRCQAYRIDPPLDEALEKVALPSR